MAMRDEAFTVRTSDGSEKPVQVVYGTHNTQTAKELVSQATCGVGNKVRVMGFLFTETGGANEASFQSSGGAVSPAINVPVDQPVQVTPSKDFFCFDSAAANNLQIKLSAATALSYVVWYVIVPA